jgi:DNA-binding MarR family transcriptional regulator
MSYEFNESLMHLVHRASQIAEEQFAALAEKAELGTLTARQFIVLAAIGMSEGQSQVAVTDLTGIDRSTMTDIIGRLQSRGLVSRSRSRQDARSYEVILTAVGRKQLAAARAVAFKVDAQLLDAIPAGKQLEFASYLRLISSQRETLTGNGRTSG